MRPLRLILSLSICLGAILVLSYYAASRSGSNSATQSASIGAYFDWQSSSLFPPSAIISLTDDNSTFFLARPANFGPTLPSKGLDGQLWIGSGFGGDDLGRGGVSGAEGELGCSDVPGWGDDDYNAISAKIKSEATRKSKAPASGSKPVEAKTDHTKRSDDEPDMASDEYPERGDGTDDHLHHPLQSSDDLKASLNTGSSSKKKLGHADIQSLQETAEIAGKVVLLTRGGCGFLEKVKWVQRRGGIGLIVGDNVRGGALVTMYARGDTSNVTIPSLFTSHMTAHLLSSLVPTGGYMDDIDFDEAARLGRVVTGKTGSKGLGKAESNQSGNGRQQQPPSYSVGDSDDQAQTDNTRSGKSSDKKLGQEDAGKADSQGWFASLVGSSSEAPHQDTRRPPSSGKIGWIQQKSFDDDESAGARKKVGKSGSKAAKQESLPSKLDAVKPDSGFVIGIQDWRDPDLLDAQVEAAQNPQSQQNKAGESRPTTNSGLKGGSITPGSGEYEQSNRQSADTKSRSKASSKEPTTSRSFDNEEQDESNSWFERLGLSNKEPEAPSRKSSVKAPHEVTQVKRKPAANAEKLTKDGQDDSHQGLWVTMTPASISSSPFLDTLLVLVVSPLVTLTIVYALLLLRSRIRRRRWRAPKSVVDRLPVRTYRTVASTPSSNSSITTTLPSPTEATSTTPLLQSGARPISQGSTRPRSRTASEVPAGSSSLTRTNNSLDVAQEKREAGLAEWRRRYGGRQKECVVCLEEYVDGVSRVMSLPCGHEFHAECISPWLTTRRRTCPICKSDVVRSIGRSTASLSSQPLLADEPYEDSEDDEIAMSPADVREQAGDTQNNDAASAEPVSREDEAFEDLERGLDEDRSR